MRTTAKRNPRGSLLVAAVALFGLGAASADAADHVTVGHSGLVTDAVFYIAEARGYYTQENLDVEPIYFDSTAKEIAPLGTGELDVGSGLISAALYNAVSRDIGIRVVAGRSIAGPTDLAETIVVRKDLVDSGRYKTLADLKDMKVALTAKGISTASVLNEALKKAGLAWGDADVVYLGFPQQTVAFANKAIDVSLAVEPFSSSWTSSGVVKVAALWGEIYPGYQSSTVIYGENVFQKRHDVGVRFMRAIMRASRDLVAATKGGRFGTDANANEIVEILSRETKQPAATIRASYAPPINIETPLNVEGMKKDLDFMKSQGEITKPDMGVGELVDLSFYKEALDSKPN